MQQTYVPSKPFTRYSKEDFSQINYEQEKASVWERMFVKTLPLSKLVPNPDDDFFKPNVGPQPGKIDYYRDMYRSGRDFEIEVVKVVKLVGGLYMVVDGHHRCDGARGASRTKVCVEIQKA